MSAPACPLCGTSNTQYGEYGVVCLNEYNTMDEGYNGRRDCPIKFFRDES